MEEKPHLVLFWTFDVPNHKLFINITDDLEYEALEGGTKGYTKTYKGVVSHVSALEWERTEKFWISQNWGHIYGYFQPDFDRVKKHPKWGWDQQCVNGFGPDGEYIDHMQRMQIVLEANDVAPIFTARDKTAFETPDCGKTIFKRVPTRDVMYPEEMMKDPNAYWPEWQQACLMQPRTKGPRLSNYTELADAGCPPSIIDKCIAGEWDAPLHPELQKYYIYPTE
jgi:hypothetical protein